LTTWLGRSLVRGNDWGTGQRGLASFIELLLPPVRALGHVRTSWIHLRGSPRALPEHPADLTSTRFLPSAAPFAAELGLQGSGALGRGGQRGPDALRLPGMPTSGTSRARGRRNPVVERLGNSAAPVRPPVMARITSRMLLHVTGPNLALRKGER
jgi:hypothetical protein